MSEDYKPLYRITVELLIPGQTSWGNSAADVGVYCFDTARRPFERTVMNRDQTRISVDVRTLGLGLYICDPSMNFTFGPWYRSPDRKAVDGDI